MFVGHDSQCMWSMGVAERRNFEHMSFIACVGAIGSIGESSMHLRTCQL